MDVLTVHCMAKRTNYNLKHLLFEIVFDIILYIYTHVVTRYRQMSDFTAIIKT